MVGEGDKPNEMVLKWSRKMVKEGTPPRSLLRQSPFPSTPTSTQSDIKKPQKSISPTEEQLHPSYVPLTSALQPLKWHGESSPPLQVPLTSLPQTLHHPPTWSGVRMSEKRTTPSGLKARHGCSVISTWAEEGVWVWRSHPHRM